MSLSRRDKNRLRKRICSFCEGRLDLAAEGHCGAIYRTLPDGTPLGDCGWIKAFRTLGIDEALRQAKLPYDKRSPVA